MGVLRCAPLGSIDHRRLTAFIVVNIEENVMKLNSKSGATLAATAATLFLAGTVVTTVSTPAAAQGKCMATNACKGQSACKSAGNSCKGMNACKSNGFTMASSEAACKAKGGAFVKG
jgi:phage tail sheath gpL-like